MTVQDLIDTNKFHTINTGNNLNQPITTPFCCDLLSIAMSKAPADSVWITVMGNMNTLAVAVLTDVACIILAEGIQLDDATLEKAKAQGITLLSTDEHIFDTALAIYDLLHE